MKCLKKITNLSLANEWISKDLFMGIKFHEKEVNREFLTWDELQMVIKKKFELSCIDLVRDIFIFCAFTGLSFIDVKQLTSEHIVKDREETFGFGRLDKKQRICAISRCWMFLYLLLRNTKVTLFVKNGMYYCLFHAIKR